MGRAPIKMMGKKFGRLVVLNLSHKDKNCQSYWLCGCDCGRVKIANGGELRRGNTKSCGCLARELQKNNKNGLVHGMSNTRIYHIWEAMKARCQNKNIYSYKYCGARGIKVCDEWLKFEPFKEWAFANGYKNNLTIDRIDNYKDYTPDNCRFITLKENLLNQRRFQDANV